MIRERFIAYQLFVRFRPRKLIITNLALNYRLNKQPPQITFKRKEKGGINLQTLVPQVFHVLFINTLSS